MKNNVKPHIICLMAPTASGKTDLAIKLCHELPIDIISVDSAMVYKGLDIGAAKPSANELENAPHRLIDIRDPAEPYSAADFREDALNEINDIINKGRIPLLVGGTMLYFKVLQQGIADLPSAAPSLREKLAAQAKEYGWEHLHQRLQKIDPASAARIHPNDPQRLQRALEVYEITGKPLSELWKQAQQELPFQFINIGLKTDRDVLHTLIKKRFLNMLDQGFMEEVKKLRARKEIMFELPAIKSVGYQQMWQHLEGELSYDEMIERAIIATRQLAKRQCTWLNSWPHLKWFDTSSERLLQEVLSHIHQKVG